MVDAKKKALQPLPIPKIILIIGSFLSLFSTNLTIRFAAKIFGTPIKFKIPKREFEMDKNSRQETIFIKSINKKVVVYEYGASEKKILLVHGWSGRGTQMFKIADSLLKNGYSTISFDAPAHGKSPGNQTIMMEFIATILFLEKKYGHFESAIGHSLGAISLLNTVRNGLHIQSLITIGSADYIKDIISDFVTKIRLDEKYINLLKQYFENKYNLKMDAFSAHLAAQTTEIPVLVIHDKDDLEVPIKCAINIHQNLKNGKTLYTSGLGHTKILGDNDVISEIVNFINTNNNKNKLDI